MAYVATALRSSARALQKAGPRGVSGIPMSRMVQQRSVPSVPSRGGSSRVSLEASTLAALRPKVPSAKASTCSAPLKGPVKAAKARDTNPFPIIDVSPLVQDPVHAATVEALAKACASPGFFYIVGHGLEYSVERVFETAKTFYGAERDVKESVQMSKKTGFRGYSACGSEITNDKPDWHECYDVMPETQPGRSLMHGPNQWPTEYPEFQTSMEHHFKVMTKLGQRIMTALSQGTDIPFAGGDFQDPWSVLRVLNYPPMPVNRADVEAGIGAHTDYGYLTMLTATSSGLEVDLGEDDWVPVPIIPGAFVCNLGDSLAGQSQGRIKATRHRVVKAGPGRMSLPFFFEPAFDTVIGEGEKAFKYGEHLTTRYVLSYPEEEEAEAAAH